MNGNRKDEIMRYINTNLTEVQRRRFLMFVNGLSTKEIAEIEECRQNAVWESIELARKKLKKILKHTGRNSSTKISGERQNFLLQKYALCFRMSC